jgi:hypothetical protein
MKAGARMKEHHLDGTSSVQCSGAYPLQRRWASGISLDPHAMEDAASVRLA